MIFFETSAKNSTGVNNMMYSCIAQLPFFEQFKVEKENLIEDLANNNSKNTEAGIFEIDVEKNNNGVNAENSSNIVLNKKNLEQQKRGCGC